MTRPYAARRGRLRTELAGRWMLVTTPANVRYLSGFTGSNGQILIGPDPDHAYLLTDHRYRHRAGTQAPELDLVLTRAPFEAAFERVDQQLRVEADHLSWRQGRALEGAGKVGGTEVVATSGVVESLRSLKDDTEIATLADACRITTDAINELIHTVVSVGRTELELARWLERRFVELGADGVAFAPIIAAGPNGAAAHHEPTDRPIKAGELLTIDAGAKVDGYHADCTRTVALGHIDDERAQLYSVVAQAQAAGCTAVAAGRKAQDVDAAARQVIDTAGFNDWFVHGTGHGVGLQIHESPAISATSDEILRASMVCTIEPGIYIPGLGGVRIEDTVLVRDDRPPRVLTDLPKALEIIA